MKPYFLMMARYNAWANLRLYKMLALFQKSCIDVK